MMLNLTNICLFFITFYQKGLSPFLAPRCRYIPRCSDYFKEALREKGLGKGLAAGFRRLLRCHPWGGSGFDPVFPSERQKS